MRKQSLVFIFFVVSTFIYSQNTFKLEGKMLPQFNGRSIMLLTTDFQKRLLSVQAATIADGTFYFEGETQTDCMSRLVLDCYPSPRRFDFSPIDCGVYLEEGNISVQQQPDSLFTVSGTDMNDKILAFSKLTNECDRLQFVETNKDNMAGRSAFVDILYGLTDDQINDVLATAPDSFKNDEAIEMNLSSREIVKSIRKEAVIRTEINNTKYTDFDVVTSSGESKKLSDYMGKSKYVVLDFWASWCGPCIKGMPHLKMLSEKYKDKGVEVIGISLDSKEDKDAWIKAVKRIDVPWTQLSNLDPEGAKSELAKAFAVSDVPYAVIINQDGIIVDCVRFPTKYLEAALERLQ